MRFYRTLCVTVLSLVALFAGSIASDSVCETPKKQPGKCVPIESCPPLEKLAKSENRNSETFAYLKNSICGYLAMVPKFCCPLDSSQGQTPTPTPNPGEGKPETPPPQEGSSTSTPFTQSTGNNSGGPVDVTLSSRLSILPLENCGQADQGKIIGGTKAKVYEYPWMAVLGYYSSASNEIGYRCGGTVINNRYILTAAHCVTGLPSSQKLVTVRLGELLIGNETDCSVIDKTTVCAPPVENYGIDEIIPHENFNKFERFADDIALIRLNQTITYKNHIQPICLPIGFEQSRPTAEELQNPKSKMIVAGWGIFEEEIQSNHLLSVFVPLATHSSCRETYSSQAHINISPLRQVCAGGKGNADSCTGDSGGPLKAYGEVNGDQKMVQFGIVSFGPRKCATEKLPGVYTRVGYYMDWILNNVRP